ncbi:MAG: TetR/AcrR family transcriptional regulator [Alphaproteobacteria bacterium]|nr:TetR/AcrR family transcriptional regulator [Alphaproteobacteria bacterium]
MDETSNETAQRILDAAEEAFADAGFAGARVNAIATAAGVNKAMLYYYFESKEGLYRAVLERVFGQIIEIVTTRVEGAEEPDIRAFLAGYRTILRSHPHLARLVARDMVDGGIHVRQVLETKVPRLIGAMSAALEKGRVEGRFNPNIQPLAATPVLVAPFILFAILSPVVEGAIGIPAALLAVPYDATAEEILLNGLLARNGEGR